MKNTTKILPISVIILFSMIAATHFSGSIIHLPIIRKDNRSPAPTSGVQILPNYSDYTDSNQILHLVGEVQNNSADTLQFIQITADLFNASGQLLATEYTFPHLDNLPPGQKTCFDLWVYNAPAGWTSYSFEKLSYDPHGIPVTNLAWSNVSGSYDPTSGSYQVLGQVRNTSANLIKYVEPIGTLYNAAGKVIGCEFSFVDSYSLNPAEISAFKLIFAGRDYRDAARYELQVDGTPQ